MTGSAVDAAGPARCPTEATPVKDGASDVRLITRVRKAPVMAGLVLAACLAASPPASAQTWTKACPPFLPPAASVPLDPLQPGGGAGDAAAFRAGETNDCPGCDLRGARLQGRDLAGADLRGVDLSGASLHRAVLADATLDGAQLVGTNLNRADLRRSSLREADLTSAMLYEADLGAAVLTGADLTDTRLQRGRLTRARLDGAQLTRTLARDANLAGADLTRASLELANFQRADFQRANLRGATMVNGGFVGEFRRRRPGQRLGVQRRLPRRRSHGCADGQCRSAQRAAGRGKPALHQLRQRGTGRRPAAVTGARVRRAISSRRRWSSRNSRERPCRTRR
jgi:uncharacterized protein YjbI with pentapeptide repeats